MFQLNLLKHLVEWLINCCRTYRNALCFEHICIYNPIFWITSLRLAIWPIPKNWKWWRFDSQKKLKIKKFPNTYPFDFHLQSIAISLQEPIFKRSDSRASMISVGSEMDSITSAAEQQLRARTGSMIEKLSLIETDLTKIGS